MGKLTNSDPRTPGDSAGELPPGFTDIDDCVAEIEATPEGKARMDAARVRLLRTEVASLRRDAARYRYLKRLVHGQKGTLRVGYIDGYGRDTLVMAVVMERADEFIDAAMARESK